MTLSFESPNDTEFLERSILSSDSVENYDDAPTLVESSSAKTQNGTKHSKLLKSNSFTEREQIDQNSSVASTNNNINNNNNTASTNHFNHQIENRETNCTSPMPRRKQARPRRRSGDLGPQDFSSQPNSPDKDRR